MRPVAVDEFCHLKFLSNVTFSPEGTTACLTVTEADRKKNGYRSCLYLYRDGQFRKLTTFGKESSFQYLDEDTILFPGKRDEGGKNSLESRYYRISLSGGEAEPAYTFPIPVSRLLPLPGGDFLAVGTTFPGFEELYLGESRLLAAYEKYRKENEDYEEIAQVPWWWNGATYTKGAYESLFYYDARRRSLRRLTELNVNVSDVKLSRDKKSVYFLSAPVRPLLPMTGATTLCRLDLANGACTQLAADSEHFSLGGLEVGDSFLLVLASDNRCGLNTDTDFYRLDYDTGELTLYARHGQSIGSSVGSDVRYGGGRALKMVGDTCYFITTRYDSAYLYRLADGVISPVVERDGSVDCFDVCGDRLLAVALYDMRAQELYDGRGKRLSRFNEAALRGKYVARPRPLRVQRDGYEIHGFVLEPMDYDPAKTYPVILDVHGGPKTVYGPVFYHEMQYWAGKGYFVIFCNPTGSDGRGEFMDIRGKYGTVDFDDIMAFCDAALEAYPSMDAENFFETGGSYGGFMTNWIIGHTDRFRACASQRSISNWFSFYGVSDIGVEFAMDQNAADPWADPEKLWFHSPMKYADRVRTPTLFIHSFEDYRCPIDQGYQMFTSLIAHGVESKMVCFRSENHELSRSGKPAHRLKRLNEITAWFDSHRL
ncbi:MAG: S9 family peptidase [Ruminococcaceae bacterium]|jgi:dipeptidyl aminopeptidase/acylaminoacyl peptidase|nr:S9 family peptidase [Oscillospiraceae bacterium]